MGMVFLTRIQLLEVKEKMDTFIYVKTEDVYVCPKCHRQNQKANDKLRENKRKDLQHVSQRADPSNRKGV